MSVQIHTTYKWSCCTCFIQNNEVRVHLRYKNMFIILNISFCISFVWNISLFCPFTDNSGEADKTGNKTTCIWKLDRNKTLALLSFITSKLLTRYVRFAILMHCKNTGFPFRFTFFYVQYEMNCNMAHYLTEKRLLNMSQMYIIHLGWLLSFFSKTKKNQKSQ